MKFCIRPLKDTPYVTKFRYNKKWYFEASTGGFFQYVRNQVTIFAGIQIKKDELVGVCIK